MSVSLDAAAAPVSLTVLTATKGHASKKLIPAWSDGAPVVDPAHSLWIAEGHVAHVQVPGLAGLQDLLGRITPRQALVHGVPTGSAPDAMFQLVVAEKYTREPGTIARTLECFSYPPDRCLLMFDYDPDPTAQVQVASAAALLDHMAALWPMMQDIGYLRTYSTRSAIRAKAPPNDWRTPPHGMHIYFLATGDVARFRELLKIKLWCAGLGFCKLATANTNTGVAALLERALVDLTVLSPERLDYVAGAQIHRSAPFYQDRPPPELHAGIVLNLDELPDATDEERQEYARRIEAARETLRPEQREQVRQRITEQAPTLAAPEQDQEITRRLTHAERDELLPEHILYFPSREITAQDLTTKAGKVLDGKRLCDPQEPSYGRSQAVLHWNNGNWLINSWAHGILKTYRLAQPAPPPPPDDDMAHLLDQAEQETSSPYPNIYLNTEMTRIIDETQAALLALPAAPIVYQRARHLSVITRGVKPPKWLHRPHDMPVILDASQARLTELASQAAQFWKYNKRNKKGEEWERAIPPAWVIETLHSRAAWPFPLLEGIVASPTLRPDGSLLDAPGYDATTGLYLDTNGTTFPAIVAKPGLDHARSAIGHLQEAVTDFPFTEPWHFSATLTAILSLVCRFAIQGNVPLFPIRANTRGSGKSLLADVISIIGTGSAAPRWPQVKEDEEERKRLLTVALAGYPCLHIDNVVRPLGSPALDMALTSSTFSDRLLGVNEARTAPLNMVWLASGNNMQFHGDTARRIVPIDLDPKMERPEERTDFTHTPLLPWIHRERPRLTMAALTIVKAYFTAGCPAQGITAKGSFEAWSDLIRQAVVWAGESDPGEGWKDIDAESNPEYEQLAQLLDAWTLCYPKHDAWTLAQVRGDIQLSATMPPQPANQWNALYEVLAACDPRYDGKSFQMRALGDAFRRFQGRTIAGRRFVTAGKYHQAQRWRVEQL